jgi:hypothetical protein
MAAKETFLSYVELHERAWGMDTYPNRPSLDSILKARVVAFWHPLNRKDAGYRITVHNNLMELNQFATDLLLHSRTRPPDKRLARLFVDQQKVKIRGVKLLLEVDGDGK